MLADANAATLDAAVAQLQGAGGSVASVVADVTRPETLQAAVAGVLERQAPARRVVRQCRHQRWPRFSEGRRSRNEAAAIRAHFEVFDRALAVNLRGALATIQAACRP
jgi:NAD(P)-dependent dehydrogenase (short-subunit alcohol dehydrogenase family)